MGLLVYKFSNYNHTAEREQFRILCKSLRDYYVDRNEVCVFIANFNIQGVELDGFIIKNDALICVEFKNYGGEIIAADNGEWMRSDGTVIKGGSGKTVYQQANQNRIQTQKGLKLMAGLTNSQVRHTNSLIVFNQAISALDSSRLSPSTKCWLHIADNTTFLEKVQDITDAKLFFEHKDILNLLKWLSIDRQYLIEEYSNPEILSPNFRSCASKVEFRPDNDQKQPMPQVANASKNKNRQPQYQQTEQISSLPSIDNNTQTEINDLTRFIEQVFKHICPSTTYTLHIYRHNDPNLLSTLPGISPKLKWFLVVQISNALDIVDKVRKFMHREVGATNGFLTFEIGLPINDTEIQLDISESLERKTIEPSLSFVCEKLKTHTILPPWIDRLLFEHLGAIYNPDYHRYSYNLNLSEEEVLNYLGTYFPRSYAEAFCIYDDICNSTTYVNELNIKTEINILDIGCGTGGELIGLLCVLDKYLPKQIQFKVEAIDGNEMSLRKFNKIAAHFIKKAHRHCEIVTTQKICSCTDDIETIAASYAERQFDFIQMCKFACELESHHICKMANPYQLLLTHFGKLLSDEGIFLLLDVTTLSHTDNMFYPQLLNMGVRDSLRRQPTLAVMLPLSCHKYNEDCIYSCFTQKEFSVGHSQKQCDISKIAYRIVAHKNLIEKLHIDNSDYRFLVKSSSNNTNDCFCQYSLDNKQILDAYKIRTI